MDELTELPIFTEMLGIVSAKVYECDGVYSLFLAGDNVACFIGNYKSPDHCKEEIRTLGRLTKYLSSVRLHDSQLSLFSQLEQIGA